MTTKQQVLPQATLVHRAHITDDLVVIIVQSARRDFGIQADPDSASLEDVVECASPRAVRGAIRRTSARSYKHEKAEDGPSAKAS